MEKGNNKIYYWTQKISYSFENLIMDTLSLYNIGIVLNSEVSKVNKAEFIL